MNPTKNQTIALLSLCSIITVGAVFGCIALEKKRKEFLKKVEEANAQREVDLKEHTIPDNVQKIWQEANPDRDMFGSTSLDPEKPVITQVNTDKVDKILPESVEKLGSRYAQTKLRRYSIYADLSVVRPGEFDNIMLDYYFADNEYLYNGFPAPPIDIEALFGRDFAEEIMTLGIGRNLTLLIFSNLKLPSTNSFIRMVLTFHEGEVPEMAFEEDDPEMYDPDAIEYSEPDESAEGFDQDEDTEIAIQEAMDREEMEAEVRFFDPDASIDLDPTGELTEAEIYEGWTTSEWKYHMESGFIHDENDDPIGENEILDWIGLYPLKVICSPDVMQQFPGGSIFVRNAQLKIMYEIEID